MYPRKHAVNARENHINYNGFYIKSILFFFIKTFASEFRQIWY